MASKASSSSYLKVNIILVKGVTVSRFVNSTLHSELAWNEEVEPVGYVYLLVLVKSKVAGGKVLSFVSGPPGGLTGPIYIHIYIYIYAYINICLLKYIRIWMYMGVGDADYKQQSVPPVTPPPPPIPLVWKRGSPGVSMRRMDWPMYIMWTHLSILNMHISKST
jgi:hypothetical protein